MSCQSTKVSCQSVKVSSQNTKVSCQSLKVSCQTTKVSCQSVKVSCQTTKVSCQSVKVSSQTTKVSSKNKIAKINKETLLILAILFYPIYNTLRYLSTTNDLRSLTCLSLNSKKYAPLGKSLTVKPLRRFAIVVCTITLPDTSNI